MGGQSATLGVNGPAFTNNLTSMFQHLLVTWGQFVTQKCSKLVPSLFGPDSSCKAGLKALGIFATAKLYLYNGAFTLDVKSMLNENLGGTKC